jgi:RimJ/RimL family protein N-acetyltransferase
MSTDHVLWQSSPVVDALVRTDRLIVRPWTDGDVDAALTIYGSPQVARWLTPAMDRADDLATARTLLRNWQEEQPALMRPEGRWAIQRLADGVVVGGVGIRALPPQAEDLELNWQLAPSAWGNGYATEAGAAVVRWAFGQDLDELFAVARPNNHRAIATTQRLGMQWVGETDKYYGLRLQVYRVRPGDLPEPRPWRAEPELKS